MNEPGISQNHKLLVALVKKGVAKKLVLSCRKVGAEGATTLLATTPPPKDKTHHNLLNINLDEQKELLLIATTTEHQQDILLSLEKGIKKEKTGKGMVLIIDIAGIAGVCHLCGFDGSILWGVGEGKMEKRYDHNLIITIVNKGHSDEVVVASQEAGAEGATVLTGRGTGIHEQAKIFGVPIEPEKELVATLVPEEKTGDILTAINEKARLKEPGKGIAFVLNVDRVAGINHPEKRD